MKKADRLGLVLAKRPQKRLLLGVLNLFRSVTGVNEMDLATLTLREYTAGYNTESGLVNASSTSNGTSNNRVVLRRCRTREQGAALMTVGHAIEYLVDTRLVKEALTSSAEREALAILLRANLTVYSEGAEIRPLVSRLRQWFHGGSIAKREPANAPA
jgi:hypothetical protein